MNASHQSPDDHSDPNTDEPGKATKVRGSKAYEPRIYKEDDIDQPDVVKMRSPWRQRLVDTERGVTHSFRGDSTFFGYLFLGTLVFCVAFVMGISALQWTLMSVAFTIVIAAEMFRLSISRLVQSIDGLEQSAALEISRIATAAVMVTLLGSCITIGVIFWQRLG